MTFKFRKARSDRTLSDLESFLRNIGDEPVEFLTRTFDDWRQISYDELEDLILSGRAQDLIDWRERYAKVVNEKLSPLWLTAIQVAAHNSTRGKMTIDDSDPRVKDFLQRRGSELTTQLSDESRKAVANVILHGQSEHLAPKEIARQIRPLIGLNQRQAQANVNYRQKIFRQLIDSGLSAAQAQIRADKAAVKYASKQHRQRAEMIVHTELARAYNVGAHEGILSAVQAKLMNHCEMVWTTAGTNRVCGRCLSLKDTVVGRTNEQGVQLPPIHPRCRCTISYREIPLTAPSVGGNVPVKPRTVDETVIRDKLEATRAELKIKGELLYPPPKLDLTGFVFDAAHTQGDRHPHNVTEAEARHFITEAYFALYFEPNNSFNFFGKDGAAYVQMNKKLIRTAFKREEYNPKFRRLVEVYEHEIATPY